MKHCQLGLHVDVISLASESILQSLLVCSPDLQQQRPVCGEAVNECFKDLPMGIQHQISSCQAASVLLPIRCLQPEVKYLLLWCARQMPVAS